MSRGSCSRPSSASRRKTSCASIAPDVGGGFGSKIFIYAEETVCVWAAKKVNRPVKWTSRSHRGISLPTRMAAITSRMRNSRPTPTARSPALRVNTIANLGAYLSTFASSVPTYLYAPLLSGQYNIPAIYAEVDGVYTNTAPVDAYRGAGRPEATFVIERLSKSRRANSASIRPSSAGKNFVTSFPHQTPVIMCYDAGDYEASLEKAQEMHDIAGFARAQGGKRAQRQAARHRLFRLYRGLRHRAVGRRRLARRRRRPVGIGRGARQSDRHGRNPHRLAFARAGARDDLRAARVRPARHPDRECLDRAWRHRQGADGHGHLWLALRRGRHVGDRQGARQDRGQGEESRGPCARSRPRATSSSRTASSPSRAPTRPPIRATIALQAYIAHKFNGQELEPGLKESAFWDPTNFTFPAGVHICELEDRSARPARRRSTAGPRSMISATSSIR